MAVTGDEIAAAYRLLLGREPKPDEVGIWAGVESAGELRRIFMTSDEFAGEIAQLNDRRPPTSGLLPRILPRLDIQWQATPTKLARLVDYIAQTWTALGASEPHWSVLSAEQFKAAHIEESADTFYASGKEELDVITNALARHGFEPGQFRQAVEYGCGIGRVTPFLAGAFQHVRAIDISASHLALAQRTVTQAGHDGVEFTLAGPRDFGLTEPFDFWYSYIVLQHNPPPLIALILERMFFQLAPNGVALFQVPTYTPGYSFSVDEYLDGPRDGTIEVHCLPQDVIFRLAHRAGCRPLEVTEDDAMPRPWRSNVFLFAKVGHDGDE